MSFNEINPGVAKLVAFLQKQGFNTTDSGDGITNVELGMEDALDFPHVFMTVEPTQMRDEAERLLLLLRYGQRDREAHDAAITEAKPTRGLLPPIIWTRRPVDFDPGVDRYGPVPYIEVTYNPFDRVAVLSLINVDDADLWGEGKSKNKPEDKELTKKRLEYQIRFCEHWLSSPPEHEYLSAANRHTELAFYHELQQTLANRLADLNFDLPPF